MRFASRRPTPGAIALGAGAVALGVAMALPWVSIPGGALVRELMALRSEPIPATGPAWRSLPLASVSVGLLVPMALVSAFLSVTRHRWSVPVAGLTAGYGVLVIAILVVKLFAGRVASQYTVVGAGGYLGLLAVVTIVVGCVMVIRPRRHAVAARVEMPDPPRGVGARSRAFVAVAAAAMLAAYLATRLSFVDRFPYFVDEGVYADFATQVVRSRDKWWVTLEIGQGPVLTWLSAVWIELGVAPIDAVRLVSVMAGLLTVGVIGLLGRSVFGAATGWVAAGLCVVLPFFVVHDGIGIYEPLVTLIIASALLLQIALARRPDPRIAAALGLVLGVGLLTKQNTLPALALLPVSLLCFRWSEPGLRRRVVAWVLGLAIVALIVGGADLLQRSSSYYPKREAATKNLFLWPARSVAEVLEDPFAVVGQNWTAFRPALSGYFTVPLWVAAAVGAVLGWRRRRNLTLVLLAWIAVPFAIGLMFQLRPFPRHAMTIVPAALVLAAYAIVETTRFARRRLPRVAAAVACSAGVALLLAPALILDGRVLARPATARYPGLDYWQYVAGWPAGGPWRSAADLIQRRAAGRRVLVLTPGEYGILRNSLGESGRFVFVGARSARAPRAQFGVYDTAGFPIDSSGFDRQLARLHFRPIARFQRPREPCSGDREPGCGASVRVFVRP